MGNPSTWRVVAVTQHYPILFWSRRTPLARTLSRRHRAGYDCFPAMGIWFVPSRSRLGTARQRSQEAVSENALSDERFGL